MTEADKASASLALPK